MFAIETIATEYPLHLFLAGNELCLYDWEKDSHVVVFPLSDKQRSAIQKHELADFSYNADNLNVEFVIYDGEKDFILVLDQNQLIMGKRKSPDFADEKWYTILVTFQLTADQLQIVHDAMERAEIYRLTYGDEMERAEIYNLTHDSEGELLLPIIASQSPVQQVTI